MVCADVKRGTQFVIKMQRLAGRVAAIWMRGSHWQLCKQHFIVISKNQSLRFFEKHRISLFLWQPWQCPWPCGSIAACADTFVVQELQRIYDDNKKHPDFVNHNLYNLLLDEDLIRLAHKNIVSAAGHHKVYYERGALVRDLVKDLEDERFKFESDGEPKKKEEERSSYGPPFRDKVALEAMRIVLEQVYGPVFLDVSHGFRPTRSRHTALQSVRRGLQHHKFALVGKIDCHDMDRHFLMKLVEKKIGDRRFLRLIWKALNAGCGDRKNKVWTIKSTWEGLPEDLTLSSTLTNIYFHALDCWIYDKKHTVDEVMSTGAADMQLLNLTNRINYLEKEGKLERARVLRMRRTQFTSSRGRNDASFRQLFYVRHEDDILLTFIASNQDVLKFKMDLEDFLVQDMKLGVSRGGFRLSNLSNSHAFFLGIKISVTKPLIPGLCKSNQLVLGRVRLEAPMEKIIEELAKLRMVSERGTRPHPATFLARCSHNEIINYYNWIMRGCCTYYSFVDNFHQLTNYLRLALRSSCVRTLTMKLKRYRSARTYKDFGTECAARYRVPVRNGCIIPHQLSSEEVAILKDRIKAAKKLKVEWENLGKVEKGLLQRFIIPRRIQEANGDVHLEFRGNYLLFCSNKSEHEETIRVLRKLELLPPAQNVWDFKETLVPPPRPRLSIDYETLYPY